MGIPHIIYMNHLDMYKILIQTHSELSVLASRETEVTLAISHRYFQRKKHQGHSHTFASCILFCTLIFGLSESEKWLFRPT